MIKLFNIESLIFSTIYAFNINACNRSAMLKGRQKIAILEFMQEILFVNELSHRLSPEKYS